MGSCSRRVVMVLMTLGVTLILFALTYDLLMASVARQFVKPLLQELLQGSCKEHQTKGTSFSLSDTFSDDTPEGPLALELKQQVDDTILHKLSGLQVGVFLHPLQYSKDDRAFLEAGAIALRINIAQGRVWVIQDSARSTMTVHDPFYNVALMKVLTQVLPEEVSLLVGLLSSQSEGPVMENSSLLGRISQLTGMALLARTFHPTLELPPALKYLEVVEDWLKDNQNASLEYIQNGTFRVAKEGDQQVPQPHHQQFSNGLGPLKVLSQEYDLPGFDSLTWRYQRTVTSTMSGLWVDQYSSRSELWMPQVLCRFTGHHLLKLVKSLKNFGVHLSSPGSTTSDLPVYTSTTLRETPAVLDVYRPAGLPVGGSLAVQLNLKYDGMENPSSSDSSNEILIPFLWINATIESLPEIVTGKISSALTWRAIIIPVTLFLGILIIISTTCYLLWKKGLFTSTSSSTSKSLSIAKDIDTE